MRDVAARAGVSVATVSHVINGTHYVSAELRRRVLAAVDALDYRPNKLAQALSRKIVPLLALVVPDISNPYWSSVARSIQDITDKHGYSVIVCSTDGLLEREVRFLRTLSGWVSGIILHPYHVTHKHISRYVDQNIPAVILGHFSGSEEHPLNWDYVGGNNRAAAQAAVEYLIKLGHRRIAFIQGPNGTPTGEARLCGFVKAHESASLPLDETLVIPGDYTRGAGRRGMTRLLDMPSPPTAVFCANDMIALGALDVARLRDCQVPGDISIVGFDDIDEATSVSPSLTTVRQPPRRLGEIAGRTLVDRLEGRTEPRKISLEFSLVVRESSGPPARPRAA